MAHKQSYQFDRDVYNAGRKRAEVDRNKLENGDITDCECIEHISQDYAQSIEVPHT